MDIIVSVTSSLSAALASAAGAALGTVACPGIGTIIGTILGAIGGGATGYLVGDMASQYTFENIFRENKRSQLEALNKDKMEGWAYKTLGLSQYHRTQTYRRDDEREAIKNS